MSAPDWFWATPQIDLWPGVPVIDAAGRTRTVLSTGQEVDDGRPAVALWDGATLSEVFLPLDEVRIDLNDPLGFGFAMMALANWIHKAEGGGGRCWRLAALLAVVSR